MAGRRSYGLLELSALDAPSSLPVLEVLAVLTLSLSEAGYEECCASDWQQTLNIVSSVMVLL